MIRKNSLYIVLLSVMLFVCGCGTTKRERTSSASNAPMLELLQQMPAMRPLNNDITARIRMAATIDDKALSSKGTFCAEQGKGIRIGITALGLFEVARLDLSVDKALLINKMGKEYAALKYSDYGFLKQAGLNYKILEAVLLNRPFSPDGTDFAKAMSRMNIKSDAQHIVVSTGQINNMCYTFYFNTAGGELVKTEGIYDNRVRVTCRYSDFEKLTSRPFPQNMSLVIDGIGSAVGLELNFSNIKETEYVFGVSDTSKYSPIDFSRIIELVK